MIPALPEEKFIYPSAWYSCFSRLVIACMVLSGVLVTPYVKSAEQEGDARSRLYLYLYQDQGPARDGRLLEKAKQEGSVVIYTSMNLKDSQPLIEAFEKKHGIKVTLWHAVGEKVALRALTEARAGRHAVDVVGTSGPQMEVLYREKVFAPFYSPAFKDLPAAAFPPHKHYVGARINFFVLAYNTKLIPPKDAPGSYEDLLDPKWTGKLGIEASDVAWFAAVTKAMGEKQGLAYFQKLSGMKPSIRNGHTLMAQLVSAGEIPMAVNAYNHSIERLKNKGAPIDWKPLQPAFGEPNAIGLPKQAPHPHAALLFADFVLSTEGQRIIQSRGFVPASLAVDSPLNKFKYEIIDPGIVLDEWDKWSKLWSNLFLKGQEFKKDAN